jgi:hypothetical protein
MLAGSSMVLSSSIGGFLTRETIAVEHFIRIGGKRTNYDSPVLFPLAEPVGPLVRAAHLSTS